MIRNIFFLYRGYQLLHYNYVYSCTDFTRPADNVIIIIICFIGTSSTAIPSYTIVRCSTSGNTEFIRGDVCIFLTCHSNIFMRALAIPPLGSNFRNVCRHNETIFSTETFGFLSRQGWLPWKILISGVKNGYHRVADKVERAKNGSNFGRAFKVFHPQCRVSENARCDSICTFRPTNRLGFDRRCDTLTLHRGREKMCVCDFSGENDGVEKKEK